MIIQERIDIVLNHVSCEDVKRHMGIVKGKVHRNWHESLRFNLMGYAIYERKLYPIEERIRIAMDAEKMLSERESKTIQYYKLKQELGL